MLRMTLERYRGAWVILGRNQAMKMLLARTEQAPAASPAECRQLARWSDAI